MMTDEAGVGCRLAYSTYRFPPLVYMNRSNRIKSFLVAGFFALTAFAGAAFASDAKVVKIVGSGSAYFTPPGGSKTKIVASPAGQVIPEKSVVETGPGIEVLIETVSGAVATLRQNSQVVLDELVAGSNRKVRLNLKAGDIVSTLDPTRNRETDYGIVTPNGVAAARGTVYSVSVVPATGANANTSVATLSGTVVIDRGPGLPPIQVPYGQGSANSSLAQALSVMAANDPTVAADIVAAVQTVANNVSSSTSASGSPETAVTLLAAVTSAAAGAVPSQAGAIVQAAVSGAVAAGSTTS